MVGVGAPRRETVRWALAGVLALWVGLAVSWVVAQALSIRSNPVVAVAEQIIRRLPGHVAEKGIQTLGHSDKPTLVAIILVVITALAAGFGLAARSAEWKASVGWLALAAVGGLAVSQQADAGPKGQIPVVAGFIVWVLATMFLTGPLRTAAPVDDDLRFWLRAGGAVVAAGILGAVSPTVGRKSREVAAAREALSRPGALPGVTMPVVPAGAQLPEGLPWATPAAAFYRVDTTFSPPEISPSEWRLRIHGMVDHEIELTFDELLARRRTQAWITLNCVSNPVGGNLIGNAWWSGVSLAALLREAGVKAGADALLQTSKDGWTCGTPLAAIGSDAMLAVAMNGQPLPVPHGFPVRTLVPGLFGYVSACKWVVDLEVTTMDKAVGYWIPLGWAVQGPVKLASRIDRPGDGRTIPAGTYTFAGVAWEQRVGIKAVDISIDGGPWLPCTLGRVPSNDTWVQWSCATHVASGHHQVAVRATARSGQVQTAVRTGEVPNGATGWHTVDFTAS